MAVGLLTIGGDAPYVDSNGDPLSAGKIYFYVAGSSTPQDTYTTSLGNVANANPVVLGSGGYPSSAGSVVQIWGTVGVSYKAILKNAAGTTIWTRDNLPVINDVSAAVTEWISGPAPTYIGATSFSLVGDQTSTFQVGRRVKTTNSGGTIYSTISASAYGALTTVTVVNDSGTLDSGLSAVSYGLLSPTSPSTPLLADTYPIVSGSADKTKKVRLEADGLTTATTRVVTVPDRDVTIGPTLMATQVTTSGTAFDFTGIPAGVRRITIIFNEISLSGTDNLLVQLGDAGGPETSAYVSISGTLNNAAASAVASNTTGFIVRAADATAAVSGTMVIELISTTVWVSSHSVKSLTTATAGGGGSKTLSAELTQVRLTRDGTDTFDNGSVTVSYE